MKKTMLLKLVSILAIFTLMLVACSDSGKETSKATKDNSSDKPKTVEITDAHGKVTVPVNPKNVVALDNRTFETLADWGIKLAAAPKDIMPADSAYKKDEKVQNIGNHREPNLEIIAAANPELVIVGQRFADHYEEIKKLVPNAAVIDLNFDVSEKATKPGENLVKGLKDSTTTLGKSLIKIKKLNN